MICEMGRENAASSSKNRAEIRHLPQKVVFGHYLARYSFHPPDMHIHSVCLVHGWSMVWSIDAILRRVLRIPSFHAKIGQIFTAGSHNRRPWGVSISSNLGRSARNFAWICTKATVWFYASICAYLKRITHH